MVSGYVGPYTGFIYRRIAVVKHVIRSMNPYVVFWIVGGEKHALHIHHAQLHHHKPADYWAAGIAGLL